MANKLEKKTFKLGNILYKYAYPLYRPLYFNYKKRSDKNKIEKLRDLIKPGMKILDIGANIGFYSVLFSELTAENGRIYAFEPEDINYKRLLKLTSRHKNIIPEKAAVGEKTETIKLYHSKDLNVDHQTYDAGENRSYSEVKCIAIDDYLKNDEKVNFIKIDIQGYDYFAVKGMKKTIARSENIYILGEFWPYGLNKAGVSYKDYIDLLRDSGFKITFFCPEEELNNFDEKINDWNFSTDFLGIK